MFIFVYCEDDKQENIFASSNITYFVHIHFLYDHSHYISDISFSLQLGISFNRTKTPSVQIANKN